LTFFDLSNYEYETYSFYPEFLQKNHVIQAYYQEIDSIEKTYPSDQCILHSLV